MTKNRILLLAPLAVVGAVLAAGAWWFLFRSVPEEANIADLVESAEVVDGGDTVEDLTGTWSVRQEESVFVGFRIEEVLKNVGDFTVVGRTPAVSGTLVADGLTVTQVEIEADVSTLKTDKSSRDNQLKKQALESNTFPSATFVMTEPIQLPSVPSAAEPLTVDAVGELTAHGVTQPVTMSLETSLIGTDLLVAGTIDILLSDFAIDSPSAPVVVSVADEAVVEFSLVFEPS